MTTFADSSAIVKLYSTETDSASVRSLEAMYVAQVARVEVPAALWRKNRMGELDSGDCRTLIDVFESDYFSTAGRLVPIVMDSRLLDLAAELIGHHGLRAYDGVQLASAVTIRSLDPECRFFAAFDVELLGAAAREGFAPLPNPSGR